MKFTAILFLSCFVCSIASAQNRTRVSLGNVQTVQDDSILAVAVVPDEVDEELQNDGDEAAGNGRERVLAPLPTRNPLLGWTLIVPFMYLYKPPNSHADDRPWYTGVAGLYSQNESWGFSAFHKMSFGGDLWRLKFAAARADFNYDFFGVGGGGDNPGIPVNQEMDLALGEALRRIGPDLFFGFELASYTTEFGLDLDFDFGFLPPDFELPRIDIDVTTLTPVLKYDTRDNEFYPTEGIDASIKVNLARDSIGSDIDYEKYTAAFNHFMSLSGGAVLASRAAIKYAAGDAPLFLYPGFGTGADLRGYQTGTYRDRYLFAVQTEYRRKITDKFGAVVFAGIGTVAPDFGDWDKSLPSVGFGVRYTVAQENNLNVRLDVARGRDDTVWYVGIAEAF